VIGVTATDQLSLVFAALADPTRRAIDNSIAAKAPSETGRST